MIRRRNLLFALGIVALVAAVAVVTATIAGDDNGGNTKGLIDPNDPEPENQKFHLNAAVAPFAGPTPLEVRFRAKAYHASGKVLYRWHFDDGTTSYDDSPIHTFTKPGYYGITLDARDEKGAARQNVVIGAWPPKLWAYSQKYGPLNERTYNRLTKEQFRRTEKRRQEQREAALRAAAG